MALISKLVYMLFLVLCVSKFISFGSDLAPQAIYLEVFAWLKPYMFISTIFLEVTANQNIIETIVSES